MISAVAIAWWFIEVPDDRQSNLRSGIEIIANSGSMVIKDRNFCLLAIAGAMFGMSITLFPHYQAIAREKLNTGYHTLLYWIVAQQVGAALLSVPAGWYADRFGNRSILDSNGAFVCGTNDADFSAMVRFAVAVLLSSDLLFVGTDAALISVFQQLRFGNHFA